MTTEQRRAIARLTDALDAVKEAERLLKGQQTPEIQVVQTLNQLYHVVYHMRLGLCPEKEKIN